jgi:hypothetical protein
MHLVATTLLVCSIHSAPPWQIGLGHHVDCGLVERPVENRYGPNEPGDGWLRVPDPDAADLWCMQCTADGSAGFDGFHGMEQVTEKRQHAGFQDDAPDDIIIMFELRVSGDAFDDTVGGSGYSEFFILRTVTGEDTEDAVRLRHARSGDAYEGRIKVRNDGVFSTHDWIDHDRVEAEEWSTVMMRYQASSLPGQLSDGRVDVWVADRRMADVVPEIDLRQVVDGLAHDTAQAKRYRLGAVSSAPGFAPVVHHFARFCRGAWEGDPASTFRAVRYRDFGVEVGVDLPSQWPGRRDVAVAYRHDRGLLGGDVEFRLEYARDPSFTVDRVITSPVPLVGARGWQETLTLSRLVADSTYWVRAVVTGTFGDQPPLVTQPCRFRTMTADTNGTIRFVVGACTQHGPNRTPNRTFETIAAIEDDLNFIAHLGDQAYVDVRLKQRFGDDWESEVTVRDVEHVFALHMGDYSQSLAATAAPFWRQWDDHEVKDSWYGEIANPVHYPKARSAFRTYTKHCRPPPSSTFYGPHPEIGASPDGQPWAPEDVFYWYTSSANVLFVMLDTRTMRSHRQPTMLGDTQLDWLLDLISTTDKEVICLFSQVRWSDGHVSKPNDYWGDAETFEGLFVEERDRIIQHFRKVRGDDGFLLLLSGDDHLSTATRHFGLGGHENVYEVLNGGYNIRTHDPLVLPSWILGPGDRYDWLTNNGLLQGQTLRLYILVEIDEASGRIELTLKDGNTGDPIAVVVPNP